MTAISERTTLTLSLVAGLIGASGFITNVWYDTKANAQTIHDLKSDFKEDLKVIRMELKENNKLLVEVLATQAKLKR